MVPIPPSIPLALALLGAAHAARDDTAAPPAPGEGQAQDVEEQAQDTEEQAGPGADLENTCTVELHDEGHTIEGGSIFVSIGTIGEPTIVQVVDDGELPDAHADDSLFVGAAPIDCRGPVEVQLLATLDAPEPIAVAQGPAIDGDTGHMVLLLLRRDGSLSVVESLGERTTKGGEAQDITISWPFLLAAIVGALTFRVGVAFGSRRRRRRSLTWLGSDPGYRPLGALDMPDEGLVVWWVDRGQRAALAEALCRDLSTGCAVVWARSGDSPPASRIPAWCVNRPEWSTARVVGALRHLSVEGRTVVALLEGAEVCEPDLPDRSGAALDELVWMAPGPVFVVMEEGEERPDVDVEHELRARTTADGFEIESITAEATP